MKQGQVWSEKHGCYVSPSFLPADKQAVGSIKIPLTKCIIIITPDGFYDLVLNDKKVKRIGFKDFIKYKGHVLGIENKCPDADYWR